MRAEASLGLGPGFSSFVAEGGLDVGVVWGAFAVDVGYRIWYWDFHGGDEILKLLLAGPSAGLSARF